MNEMALCLDNLHVSYGAGASAQPVLNGFSLSLRQGTLACLLGASGSGKTTVLRAIAGFERLDRGSIRIAGRCVASPQQHLAPELRRVGMVFQDYALFPHLTVAQNIAFGLRRQPRAVQRARVADLLQLIELSGSGERYPHALSGGQQQRVALARALAPQPDILLLDEPFSSLDEGTRERLGQEVRAILAAAGQTALLVTHSAQEARTMGGPILHIAHGQALSCADAA
ncbi:MAG: ABC transporter ATP-binding protein [Edwardsiella piscicida]